MSILEAPPESPPPGRNGLFDGGLADEACAVLDPITV